MARRWRLSRVGFIAWLIAPVVVVAILWTQMDRTRGRPDSRFVQQTEPEAAAAGAAPAPAAGAAASQPAMVEPESLPQGFVIVVEDRAKLASPESPIYLASSHHGWRPGEPSQRLTARSDGRWQIVVSKPELDSRIEFKFTRGNWATVEVAEDLGDVGNRMLPLVDASTLREGEQPIIEFVVPKWADQRSGATAGAESPYRAIRVAGGTIRRVQVAGGGVPITRDLLVWLPPGYGDEANRERTYPVLYMQDGQNIFEKLPSVPGEWRADETAIDLIERGVIEPLIIVGIPHAGVERMSEYLPTPAPGVGGTPRGDAYVEFLVRQVLPRVERAFRVKTGPEHTAIGGSSLGGLISLYAGLKHPEVFGKVLAESPSLVIRGEEIWKPTFDGFKQGPRVIIMGMGGKEYGDPPATAAENAKLVEALNAFAAWLTERKIGEQVDTTVDDNARHNEEAWAKRLPRALEALFGK